MIRPIPGEPVQVAPRNGLTVSDPRPTFTWYRAPDATAYRIQIRRADGGTVRRYEADDDTTWTLPDDAPPLVPGADTEVAESLASLGGMGLDPAGDGLFLTALAYRDAGLYYEAESDEIPLETRMMTVADVFDALTASDRPYKKAMPVEKALQILQWEAEGGQLDPDLVELFRESRVYERVLETDWREL